MTCHLSSPGVDTHAPGFVGIHLEAGLSYGFALPQTILPNAEGKPAMKNSMYVIIACLAIGFGFAVAAAYDITTQMAGTIEAR